MSYAIEMFGADPAATLNTQAIQQAIDAAHAAGGGQVVVPSGTFVTGALFLKSNVELHLTAGAVLKFSDRQADYPVVRSRWEGVLREVYASCIYSEGAENIALTGLGLLDGNGRRWWQLFREKKAELLYPRPKLISFDNCRRVTLQDLQLKDSPSWTVNPIRCENVTITNLTITNPADSPNTDGIDPESCRNVRISNCHIDVGDDCIAVKAGTEETVQRVACENIVITNCTMVHGHGGVVLGSEMSGDIRNVTISNCVFQDTDRGIRLKSRRGRGGIVEDIRVSNIVMDRVMCPFIINLYYFCGPQGKEKYVWDKAPYSVDERTPAFRRIHFMNVTARNVHAAAGFIYGLSERYASEITFNQVAISMAEAAVAGKPAMMTGIQEMKRQGFFIGFAKDLLFDGVTIENHEGPAFILEDTEAVEISRCRSYGTKQPEMLVLHKESGQ